MTKNEKRALVVLDAISKLEEEGTEMIFNAKIRDALNLEGRDATNTVSVCLNMLAKSKHLKVLNAAESTKRKLYRMTAKGRNHLRSNALTLSSLQPDVFDVRAYPSNVTTGAPPPQITPDALQAISGITELVNTNHELMQLLKSVNAQITTVINRIEKPEEQTPQQQGLYEDE